MSVDRHHRHLAQHVEHSRRLGVSVLGHVVAHLVDLHFHERFHGHHLYGAEHLGIVLAIERVEVEHLVIAQLHRFFQVELSDAADGDVVHALGLHLMAEPSLLVGEEDIDRIVGLALFEHAYGGERLALGGCLAHHHTLDGGLCHGS